MARLAEFFRCLGRLLIGAEEKVAVVLNLLALAGIAVTSWFLWDQPSIVAAGQFNPTVGELCSYVGLAVWGLWNGGAAWNESRNSVSRPNLVLQEFFVQDVGLYETPIGSRIGQQGAPVRQCKFLKARLLNAPRLASGLSEVKKARYRVTFFDSEVGHQLFSMDGRWPHTPQPSSREFGDTTADLLRVDIDNEELVEFDLVFKELGDADCWGWNNASYYAPSNKLPAQKLGAGRFRAKVKLSATNFQRSWTIWFENLGTGKGFRIIQYWEDKWWRKA